MRRRRSTPRTPIIRLPPHRIQRPREIRLDPEIPQIRRRLLNPLNLPTHIPRVIAFLLEPSPHNIHHSPIELVVELAAGVEVGGVLGVEAAMGVEVATELEDEVEGEFWAGGEGGQARDVREEFGHGGGEVGGGD